MLYQELLSDGVPERGGYDIEQVVIRLEEELEIEAFSDAWTFVARRHPVLSTRFRWRGVVRPEQEPQAGVVVPVSCGDWSAATEPQQFRLREEFLAHDRQLGFDLTSAPLLRITLFALGNGRWDLLWTFHHILLDGRSFARVLREVWDTYAALVRGEAPSLPPAPRHYFDYIAWLARQDRSASLPFFKALLQGKTAPTPLPCAEPAPRPLRRKGHGEVTRRLDPEVTEALKDLARRNRTSLGSVVQATWALVLSRMSGDDDVLFGVTRSTRRSSLEADAEAMVGLFINTLPARIRIEGDATVAQLLTATHAQSVALRVHDQTSLVEIQGQSEIPRGTPLFETLLMFDNRDLNCTLRRDDPAWKKRTCTLHEQPSTPLTVIVVDDEATDLRVLFDRRRFRDEVAERIIDYLVTAFGALPTKERVGDIDVLPARERETLLFGWNNTALGFDRHRLIHQPFEAQVDRAPHAVAVELEGALLTYAELEARANRVAHALRARGLGPGRYVGVCLSRGFDLVAALLGISKSGAAYVPIDPEYPRERVAFMLADAQAALVVTEPRFHGCFAAPILSVEGEEVTLAPAPPPAPVASSPDPCYAIYTSGSTGRPKGVILTHRAVINTFEWVSRTFGVGPSDRLLFVTSPSFDLSVYDTFGALGAGATVVIASTARMQEPRELACELVNQRITIWDSAPAALQRLVPFFQPGRPGALRLVMLSGDWIPLSLPVDLRIAFPDAQIMSLGGATEAAIWSNWFPVGEIDPRWTSVPYGRPIQNARYHVLDRRLQPVPTGAPGDLYIGGTCLAEGYLNRPELTAERFIADPFRAGERLYRTGDLARYFDDGVLEFLGRADFQVKIRGYRVELGEVEAVLTSFSEIREAVCTGWVDTSSFKVLVAYVVLLPGAHLGAEELKERVAVALPDFMVPSRVIFLHALPLSSNGKVDHAALPTPTNQSMAGAHVAPRNEVERRMVAIWEDLLGCERIGVTDNFFSAGGDSLLAVAVVSRVKGELGINLPLSRVLERPTIEGLLASIEQPLSLRRHLVTLKSHGRRPPLVLVSGIGGFGFIFRGVVARLGADQPVHVLHAVGAENETEGVEHSIEELASIYEPQVLDVCQQGPIVLGGYSFGVLIAFELALRLERAGRPAPLLVSFDGFSPGHPEMLPLPERLVAHVKNMANQDWPGLKSYLRDRVTNLNRRFDKAKGNDAFAPPSGLDSAVDQRLRLVAAGLWRARNSYRPTGMVSADLLLLKAATPLEWPGSRTDAHYGWRPYIRGRIETAVVPGAHLHLFAPENAPRMAEELERGLRALWEKTQA